MPLRKRAKAVPPQDLEMDHPSTTMPSDKEMTSSPTTYSEIHVQRSGATTESATSQRSSSETPTPLKNMRASRPQYWSNFTRRRHVERARSLEQEDDADIKSILWLKDNTSLDTKDRATRTGAPSPESEGTRRASCGTPSGSACVGDSACSNIAAWGSDSSGSDLDEDYIRCICGNIEEDEARAMICCDGCTAWQHNVCMGLTETEEDLPSKYFCELCQPQDHQETFQALKRGERVWIERKENAWEERVIRNFIKKLEADRQMAASNRAQSSKVNG